MRRLEAVVTGLAIGLNVSGLAYVGTPAHPYIMSLGLGAVGLQLGLYFWTIWLARQELRRSDAHLARAVQESEEMYRRITTELVLWRARLDGARYVVNREGTAILCGECGRVSWNENDVRFRYCGNCHKYLETTH